MAWLKEQAGPEPTDIKRHNNKPHKQQAQQKAYIADCTP